MHVPLFGRRRQRQAGFTLIELLVVVAIIAVLAALATVNLGQPASSVGIGTTVNTLLADLKSQQLLAMSGYEGGASSQQEQGIYIQSDKYTLFAGSSYSAGNSSNFVVDLGSNVALTTTLPASQIVFDSGDGATANFTTGTQRITVSGTEGSSYIDINRYGSTTLN